MPGDGPFDVEYGKHYTVVGSTGAGKTMFVKWGILPRVSRFIIVDSKARANGKSIDFTEKCFVKCDVDRAVRLAAGKKNFRLRIPTALGDAGFQEVEDLSEGLLKKNGHDCLVFLDEVTDLSDAWSIGPMLEGLIRKARGYKISVIVGSQKPAGVSGWFADNSAHIVIFGMKTADSTRYVKRTGAAWVGEVQPKIPIGSFKFAHESAKGEVSIWNPVPEYDWEAIE